MRPILILCLLLSTLAGAVSAQEVTVFAAASLQEVVAEIAALHRTRTGTEVSTVFAGSSALARQIDAGAPADVAILANEAWADWLATRGRIAEGTRADLLTNALVVVGPAGAPPLAPEDLPRRLGDGRLALALTEAVPAGIYAREALTSLGLWDALAPSVVEADNVRAALALVATGAAPLGIVYATDAAADPRVAELARLPADSHTPIRYPAFAVAGAGPEARAFLDTLTGPDARAVFDRAGFGRPD